MNKGARGNLARMFFLLLTVSLLMSGAVFSTGAEYDLVMDDVRDLTDFLDCHARPGGSYTVYVENDIDFAYKSVRISASVSLTFIGGGDSPVRLKQDDVRHFVIAGDACVSMSFTNVILDGVGTGGGISVSRGASLTFSGIIESCVTDDEGGAIFSQGKVLTIQNSGFYNCRATAGGAISCEDDGEVRITGSVFSGNSAIVRGGAINLKDLKHFNDCERCIKVYERLSMDGCTFSGNTCDAGASYISQDENPMMYAVCEKKITNVISVSDYTLAYNNLDITFISDSTPTEPEPEPDAPPVVPVEPIGEYDFTIIDSFTFEASDTYPEPVNRAVTWRELSEMLEPAVYCSGMKQVIANITLTCEDYENQVDFAVPGEYTVTVCASFTVGAFSHIRYIDVVIDIQDTVPPEISVSSIELSAGYRPSDMAELLELAGCTVTDNTDEAPEVWAEIVFYDFAQVDWSRAGQYGVYVYAMDESENQAQRGNFVFTVTA